MARPPHDPAAPGHGEDLSPTEAMALGIDAQRAAPIPWKTVVKRAAVLVIAGIAIYLVFPSIVAVLGSWPRLSTLEPIWLGIALAAQVAHFLCTFALQRLALRTKAWFSVITAQLTGNAITLVMPGGAAAGAAVQFRMLSTAGIDAGNAVGGLTAFSLLGIGGLLALPLFALPAILFGAPIRGGLVHAAFIGLGAFVLFAGFSALIIATDRPLALTGKALQRLHNRFARKRPKIEGLDARLLSERDAIRSVLGRKWWEAVLLSAGRLGLDYLTLLAALRATGSHPRPSLVLLAYAVAGVIGLIPITPGGLGIVEASLSGLLILAGVSGGDAVLATLVYRLASYWLPLLAGPVAYFLFRRRYGTLSQTSAGSTSPSPS